MCVPRARRNFKLIYLRDQLKRIEGAKSEFERLLSQDEINLAKNAAQKAWTEECVRKASKIVSDITIGTSFLDLVNARLNR
jgi:hypothetical protein